MGFSTSSRKVYLDLTIFHDFSEKKSTFRKSSGKIFWIRGFVDVRGVNLLAWFSFDSDLFFIFLENMFHWNGEGRDRRDKGSFYNIRGAFR